MSGHTQVVANLLRHAAPLWLVFGLVASAVAQSRLAPVPQNLTTTEECRSCHFRRIDEPLKPEFRDSDGFCAEVEATIWTEQDKHRQSLYLLVDGAGAELTRRILGFDLREILVIKPPADAQGKKAAELLTAVAFRPDLEPGDGRVAVARACFACHAPIAEPRPTGDASTTLEYGVSCQACHGPGYLYLNPHKDKTTKVWRVVKPEIKERLFGLRDLRHPVRRAALCSSCHVGSFSDEWKADPQDPPRFVKHEWYAKGHPPLPSLEFATFARYMPAHWKRIQEKPLTDKPFTFASQGPPPALDVARFTATLPLTDEEKKKVREQGLEQTYLMANQASYATIDAMALAADAARTRDVFVSGATVLGSYAKLLSEAPTETQRDFAIFDCGACHHELRSRFPTDARVRRRLAPGRPPPAFWTLVLARQGASLAQVPDADLDADVDALYAAFGQRPFGNWEDIRPVASRLSDTCSKLAQALTHAPLDETASRKLLAGIVGAPHDADRDYHAARQLAWAAREILRDRARIGYGADNSPAARKIDELFGGGPWQGDLRLKLPAGQEQTITRHLSESLEAISSFDPATYRDLLKQVPLDEPSTNPNR